jgi:hypothetical protein
MTRHKCFVSFHRADHASVVAFKRHFDDVQDTFIFRGQEMPEDIIRSNDDDYVIGRIRERFLKDSTVTIVLVGACTWARKFVDWEVQASLRRPAYGRANGLLAIVLDPTLRSNPAPRLPERVDLNVESGYAKYHWYPSNRTDLARWIDDAYRARTESWNLRKNPRGRKVTDDRCLSTGRLRLRPQA